MQMRKPSLQEAPEQEVLVQARSTGPEVLGAQTSKDKAMRRKKEGATEAQGRGERAESRTA